jgi:hypothetical protein
MIMVTQAKPLFLISFLRMSSVVLHGRHPYFDPYTPGIRSSPNTPKIDLHIVSGMDNLTQSMPLLLARSGVLSEGTPAMDAQKEQANPLPDHVIETLSRYLLPRMQEFFESDAGKAEYESWLQAQTENPA